LDTSTKIAILFFAWAAISAVMIARMLLKWERFYPDKPSLRWFHFLLRVTAFIAFIFLGIVNTIWKWD
jgi:hypothetical protein